MAGLGGMVRGIANSVFSSPMGKKNSFIKGDKASGTINEMVNSQETANELLAEIRDAVNSLGGDGDSLFSSFSEEENSNSGLGGLIQDKVGDKIGSAVSDKIGKSSWGSKLFGNLTSMGSSMSSMGESMKGMGGSMGGAMAALQIVNKVLEAIRSVLGLINDTVQKGIDQSITNQKQYLGPISARLQTFTSDSAQGYKDLSYEIRNVFTNSRYINQQDMLKNLSSLVEQGIGYNLEDRAYLMTITDRTVKTFDLLDANLNRMIRLQQTDLSRPQMGLEAKLTKFLNTQFEDTSYLNSLYDTVTAALIDATSQMSHEETTGYLYNVQKWLSSLYAVGISDSAINTIAQGLNYLGSGNVSQLTGNDTLNTLFAMSAQRAGLSYAQLLTTGVSEENVDKLLRSMVEYLQSIAENTSSEVLRSEYGRVFGGLSVSDLRAIQNLTEKDLTNIDSTSLSYEGAYKEVTEQIKAVAGRTSIASQVENMFNNIVYSIGAQVAENEDLYKTWVMSSLIEQLGDVFGEAIPGVVGDILANGTAVVTGLIKTTQIARALHGDDSINLKGLTMFKDYEFDEVAEKVIEENTEKYEEASDSGNVWEIQAAGYGYNTAGLMEGQEYANSVKQGIANWDIYSQVGTMDAIGFYGDKWKEGTSRMNNYSSSIALNENAFDEAQGKIESASEQITGIDDTVQTLDNLYDSLFGEAQRTINVRVVDVDGNLVGSTTTNSYSSNFDVEQNFNLEEFLASVNAAYKIE